MVGGQETKNGQTSDGEQPVAQEVKPLVEREVNARQ
jgi:hypothetical protein